MNNIFHIKLFHVAKIDQQYVNSLKETIALLRTIHNDVFIVIVQWLCHQDGCIGREMRQQASGGRPVDRATIAIVAAQILAFGERLETVRLKVHNDAGLGDLPPVLCSCSEQNTQTVIAMVIATVIAME